MIIFAVKGREFWCGPDNKARFRPKKWRPSKGHRRVPKNVLERADARCKRWRGGNGK